MSLIFHLGMSGRIRLMPMNDYRVIKHDHILIKLNNKTILAFNDPRKFGFIDYSMTSKLKNKKYFLKLQQVHWVLIEVPFSKHRNAILLSTKQ